MTATEPAAPAAPTPAAPPEAFAVTRAEWQRLLDRLAALEATILRLQDQMSVLLGRAETDTCLGGNEVGPVITDEPHVAEATAAFYAELGELRAHRAAHPADRWVGYRGRQRVGFGPTGAALSWELEKVYPDRQFHVLFIDTANKYPGITDA